MDPLGNARRRASATSPDSRRGLYQTSLSSLRSGGSRSSNDKGISFAFTSLRAAAGSWRNPRSIRLTPMLNDFLPALLITGTEIHEDRAEVYKKATVQHGPSSLES